MLREFLIALVVSTALIGLVFMTAGRPRTPAERKDREAEASEVSPTLAGEIDNCKVYVFEDYFGAKRYFTNCGSITP